MKFIFKIKSTYLRTKFFRLKNKTKHIYVLFSGIRQFEFYFSKNYFYMSVLGIIYLKVLSDKENFTNI